MPGAEPLARKSQSRPADVRRRHLRAERGNFCPGKQSAHGGPLQVLRSLGPGLIAGASDNDPTTVATLSVVGATTAFGLLWLVVLLMPMLVVVQVTSAQVGVVAKKGLEDAVCDRFGRVWGWVTMLAVLAVTLVTLAADLEGGGAALGLLTGLPYQWFLAPCALAAAILLTWGSYAAVQRILRYVVLVFLAYIVAAVLARPDWSEVLRATLIPHFELSQDSRSCSPISESARSSSCS